MMKRLVWLVIPSLVLGAAGSSRAQEPAVTGSELLSRQELVETLLAAAEARIGNRLDEGFRAGLKARLTGLPEGAWTELERTRDLSSVKGPLGGSAASGRLVYRTVPPCRILDTRAAGGALAPGTVRPFKVTGLNLDFQGGNAAGCDVPPGPAVGALINFVAVNPVGPGNLKAWAFGASIPNASILNYASVPGLNIANGIAIPICDQDPSPAACTLDFNVQADVSATHLVADVVGYFEKYHPVAINTASGGATTLHQLTVTCTNAPGNEITVTVPSTGKVLVTAQARLEFQLANTQQAQVFVGASNTDCTHHEGSFLVEYPVGATANPYRTTGTTWAVFDISGPPFTRTFYLNGFKTQNQAGRNVALSQELRLSALFIPN